MSPRTGRPKSDNSKDTMFRVRLDDETVQKLEFASEQLNITKSDVVRNGIESEYQRSLKNRVLTLRKSQSTLYQPR